jgi:hypothetical protein
VNAVGADQHVGLDPRARLTAHAVHEPSLHAARALVETREMVPRVHARRAESIEHRPMEYAEQRAPMHGELRPAVAGGQPARLTPDLPAVLGKVDQVGGGNRHGIQIIEQPELRELAGGVREHVDPDAQLLHARRRLVDVDVTEACRVQRQRERHSADTAAGDRDSHGAIASFTELHAIPPLSTFAAFVEAELHRRTIDGAVVLGEAATVHRAKAGDGLVTRIARVPNRGL